jgi:hypothetical protein
MLERYNPILAAIKGLCPTAHIGGGAVRDTLLDRPIRDIDLFLNESATDEAAALLRKDFGFVKVGEWKSYEMFSDPAVARVARFEKADETIPLCLIGLHYPSDTYYDEPRSSLGMRFNLSRFDFGICMVGWDGNDVYTTREYKRDVEQKTFTLLRADDKQQFAYSMSRFKKMTADRYAGWRLVVPAKFKTLEREHALRKTHYLDSETYEWIPREVDGPQLLTPKAR